MTDNLSATNFRDPLLLALGELSGWTAGKPVASSDTYDPVMASMDIGSIDAYGVNEASGQPQVAKWIQWANTALRQSDLTCSKGRGKWALTDEGLRQAQTLRQSAPVPATSDNGAAAPAPAAAVASRTVPLYHDDPYIVQLAADAVGCYGYYSPHGAALCGECPLAQPCRQKQYDLLGQLAVTLAQQDAAAAAAAAAAAGDTGPADPDDMVNEDEDTTVDVAGIDFSRADVIKARIEAVCAACGKAINKEEKCRWIEEMDGTSDGSLFHMQCSGGE